MTAPERFATLQRPSAEELEDLALRLELDYREHRYQNCQRAASMLRRCVPSETKPIPDGHEDFPAPIGYASNPLPSAPSAVATTIDPDELAALRKDRASLNAMAGLLAQARRERDEALQGRPVSPHRSGGPTVPDAQPSFASSSARETIPVCDAHTEAWFCGRNHLPAGFDHCIACCMEEYGKRTESATGGIPQEVYDTLGSIIDYAHKTDYVVRWAEELRERYKPNRADSGRNGG